MDATKKFSYIREENSLGKTLAKGIAQNKIPKYTHQSSLNQTGEGGATTCASRSGSRSKTPMTNRPVSTNTVATISAK